jgi:hypothetical protein
MCRGAGYAAKPLKTMRVHACEQAAANAQVVTHRPRPNVLQEPQQVAVRILDHELAAAEQDIASTVPTGLQFDEQAAVCSQHSGVERRDVGDLNLQIDFRCR